MREIARVVLVMAAASTGMAQTPGKETDTLQSLLVEVRGLRQDLEAMTVATQRVQIALYGLQMQGAAVGRAVRRLDDAREKLAQSTAARDHLTGEFQRLQASLESGGFKDSIDAKAIESRRDQMKAEVERLGTEVGSRQAAEAEAASQLRSEEAKMGELEGRIEKLDKALETLGAAK